MKNAGTWVWAAGLAGLGLVGLAFGDFEGGQPWPRALPDRAAVALVTNLFLVVAAAAACWRRTRAPASGALAFYWIVVVSLLLGGRLILLHPGQFGSWSNVAEVLAPGVAGLVVLAGSAPTSEARADALVRGAQVAFGICAILFGVAHFVYMNLTAPLVPRWLPGSGVFWGYATGVAQIAAGLAIASGVLARLAAVLLAAMYVVFQVLVHLPLLIDTPGREFFWSENALNLTLVGAALVMAGALGRTTGARGARPSPP